VGINTEKPLERAQRGGPQICGGLAADRRMDADQERMRARVSAEKTESRINADGADGVDKRRMGIVRTE
jgi:hypothetical protein